MKNYEELSGKMDIIIERLNNNEKTIEEKKILRHISDIAKSLECCNTTAQAIKNKIPTKLYHRMGRKFWIDEKVLFDYIKKIQK